MAIKKLEGDLNVTGSYKEEGKFILTTATDEYNPNSTYYAGDVCTYQGTLYRCVAQTSSTWDSDAWILELTSAVSIQRSYTPEINCAMDFPLSTATPSYDDGTTTITLSYPTPTWAGIVTNSFTNFMSEDRVRAILWPNTDPELALVANVAFHDFVFDGSNFENGVVTLSCFSPLCTLVVASNAAEGSEGTTITIAFNAVGASMYALLKSIMQGGQYPGVKLVPVVAYL